MRVHWGLPRPWHETDCSCHNITERDSGHTIQSVERLILYLIKSYICSIHFIEIFLLEKEKSEKQSINYKISIKWYVQCKNAKKTNISISILSHKWILWGLKCYIWMYLSIVLWAAVCIYCLMKSAITFTVLSACSFYRQSMFHSLWCQTCRYLKDFRPDQRRAYQIFSCPCESFRSRHVIITLLIHLIFVWNSNFANFSC